tara:strand:- start:12113 stop:13189 length:1077 start_codon:yes stop_codon:yes gene_type:complete
MVIKTPQVKTILNDPAEAARLINLVYVTNNKLTIKRHRRGKGFYYTKDGSKIVDKEALARFKSLVIPPAWQKVKITHLKNGHLQVVGRDAKNRKQYRYHPQWTEVRNKTKFFKMASFGNILPQIRNRIDNDLKLPTMTKRKCLALVVSLMEETHIRIGNEYYAKQNKTYGLSTLRTKHIEVFDNKLKFEFVGKKGKEHSVTLKNKKLQKLVLRCEEIPGWELFKYYDENGKHHSIDSGMVNDYIQEISGDLFSAKDFRTWAASKIFFETLYEFGIPETKKQKEENIIAAYDMAAKGLGNTRAVCKKYYVHPILPEKYLDNSIEKHFKELDKNEFSNKQLSPTESVMLDILNQFTIVLK